MQQRFVFLFHLYFLRTNYVCRSMVEPLFTREHVETVLRPQIQATVDSLLDDMIATKSEGGVGNRQVDLVQVFSLPLPSHV